MHELQINCTNHFITEDNEKALLNDQKEAKAEMEQLKGKSTLITQPGIPS